MRSSPELVGVDVQEEEEELPAFRSSRGGRPGGGRGAAVTGCRAGAAATGALFFPPFYLSNPSRTGQSWARPLYPPFPSRLWPRLRFFIA